jgi:hypothetical protein
MRSRGLIIGGLAIVAALGVLLLWHFRSAKQASIATESSTPSDGALILDAGSKSPIAPGASNSSDNGPTNVYAHNLMLRKGSTGFRVYVRWLRGLMVRTSRSVNPSFDDPDSFVLDVKTGVVHTNVGDLANFMNEAVAGAPFRGITLTGDGDTIKLRGTLHKIIPLPVELTATIGVAPGNRVQIHVTKLNVLKIPLKGLLGGFHVEVANLFHPGNIPGIEVSGNDIFLDTQKLVPPPHIRGELTSVRIVNPDVEEIYGDAKEDLTRVQQWRNYLQLDGGTIDFGKLTMRHVDLIMVDLSDDAWFDLDLTNYQEQLVNGYTRMTPQAGLQIFMPDLDTLPHNKNHQTISLEWLKNRNINPPADLTSR